MASLKHKLGILLKDSVVYGLSEAITKFLALFLVPIFTRVFTPIDYGAIDLIMIFAFVTVGTLMMGMDSAVARYYYDDPNDRCKSRTIFSTGLYFELLFSIVVCLVLFALSGQVTALLLKDSAYRLCLLLVICTIPFMVWRNFVSNLLKWKRERYKYILLSITEVLVRSLLSIYLVVFRHQGVQGFFAANLIAYVGIFVVGLLMTYKNYAFKFSFSLLRKLVFFGFPYAIISLSMQIMAIADRYFLNYYASLEEVGLYTLGQRIASITSLVVVGFQTAWGPFVLYIHKDKDAKQTYAKVLEYYVILTSLIFAFITVFSNEILLLLSTPEYLGGAKVIGILALNVVLNGIYYVCGVGPGITKKSYYSGIAVVSGMMANLLLNFTLVPRFGMRGAATATVLATLTSAILIYVFSQRAYSVKYNIPKVCSTFGLAFFIVAISSIVPDFSLFVNLTIKLSLMFVLMCAIIFSPILDSKERNFVLTLHRRIPAMLSESVN